jgi:tetratricopeptide (TPR) repeat protein
MTRSIFVLPFLVSTALALSACDGGSSSSQSDDIGQIGVENSGPYPYRTVTGDYLSGRFAQNRSDWAAAGEFLSDVMATNPDNLDLKRRAMALDMGSGRFMEAIALAHELDKKAPGDESLGRVFLLLESFKMARYGDVLKNLGQMPQDGIGEFISPLISAWAAAGEGKTASLATTQSRNPVHLYHAILIADYLGNETALKEFAGYSYGAAFLPSRMIERIADIFARHGLKKEARVLYTSLVASSTEEKNGLSAKIKSLEGETSLPTDAGFAPPVASPQEGLAMALSEMASVLLEAYEDSGRLFAQMALYLAPNLDEPRLLLSYMAGSNGRHDEAIAYLQQIAERKTGKELVRTRRQIADLLEDAGKTDQAVAELRGLVETTGDVDSQIQIGDLYRSKEDYAAALEEYNKAYDLLGGNVPQEYWQLIYARGMTNERLKNWEQAEKDLESALAYEPDHPYILNYLGYSWADQGVNLDKAAEMVAKAVRLRPDDGYIVDSLGWVYYRMGKYAEAAKTLEQAIELLPYDPTVNDHLGDAYWQVGRKTEAQFQWKRALSFTKEDDIIAAIEAKLKDGLPPSPAAQKLSSAPPKRDAIAVSKE